MKNEKFSPLLLLALLFLFPAGTPALAATYADLTIEAVTVDNCSTGGCSCQWHAVVKNNASDSLIGSVTIQGSQGSGTVWQPAGGTSVSQLGAGQTRTTTLTFTRAPGSTMLNARIYSDGQYHGGQTANLPPEPVPSFTITNGVITDPTHYSVDIRNTSSGGMSEVTIQVSAENPASPGIWHGAGGWVVPCISAGEVFTKKGPLPAGSQKFKVDVKRNFMLISSQIFDFTPPPATTNPTRDKLAPTLPVQPTRPLKPLKVPVR